MNLTNIAAMRKNYFSLSILLILIVCAIISCKKNLKCENCIDENEPPVANAGVDSTIILVLPEDSITLNGQSSVDPDGNIKEYSWSKVWGPSSYSIVNSRSAVTSVKNLTPGVYQFELKVTDSDGLTGRDTVQVRINHFFSTQSCDNRPVINARLVQVGTLSLGRNYIVAAAAGNKILFGGGNSESGLSYTYSSRVDIYDVEKNKWSVAELTVPERQGMAVATVGNKILFAGGGDNDGNVITSRVDLYDASNDSWTTTELSQPRSYLAAATLGSRVYFAGGFNTSGSNVVDIYDNSTNEWTTAFLSQARGLLAATTVGDKIYFAGGVTSPSTVVETIDIFDGSTNSWSTSQLSEPKAGMASIVAGNNIFWASGSKSFSPPTLTDNVEIRNVKTGVTSYACMLPRSSPIAVVQDDNIIFFTGYGPDPVGTQFEIYNITSDTWSTAVLNQGILGAAVISVNNKVYVAGGSSYQDFPPYHKEVWRLEF
jgi:N-acetylneuraminic acid mutarotase